jgi:vacuolar-type H+-ATPase subunit F/Vma7
MYEDFLKRCQLAGPTKMRDSIDLAARVAVRSECTQANQKFTILLVMTDGLIDDLNDTIREIISASGFPLSIIIVGIGNADFTNMKILDGDDKLLQHGDLVSLRDIVQFIP